MRYLTVKQVKELLPLSKSKIYELAKSGTLPGLREPRILIEEAGLLEYIEAQRAAAEAKQRPRTTEEILAELQCKKV